MRSAMRLLLVAFSATACNAPDQSGGVPASFEVPGGGGPAVLATIPASDVVGRVGPGGHVFSVADRTTELTQYPCTSCHTGPTVSGDRGEEEHADVQPTHPSELALDCATCHSAANPEDLVLQNGETASLDEAYRLCAQCHFQQGDAWAGGAHGKRLAGWRGERIVMNCTACHDPHSPLFDERIPFKGPNIPRNGGAER